MIDNTTNSSPPDIARRLPRIEWFTILPLLAILALGAWLRFSGLNWDSNTHLHPDERFLTLVETAIQLPASISEYFDTANSPLNARNVGYGFFVYGTFPIFLVRFLAEATGFTGYDQVHLLGRAVSASFDLVSIVIVFYLGRRIFDRRVGMLAAFFAATSVLLIQHSHYFVVDSIANTFILLGLYFAFDIQREGRLRAFILFGIVLGLSVSSKISAFPLAAAAALAAWFYIQGGSSEQVEGRFKRSLMYLVAAAVVSLVVFRIVQPYAFSGPGILDVKPEGRWLSNMAEIREQQKGNTDAPYALQWADRPKGLFSFSNMILWGLGIPLGLTAWFSWGWAAARMVLGEWQKYVLLVVWTGGFFIWQSIGFTMAMRYLIPIYPTLAILAAWGLIEAYEGAQRTTERHRKLVKSVVLIVGGAVLAGTFIWAVAFTSIYRNPLTRVSASRWIYGNIPGAINLVVQVENGETLEVIPLSHDFHLVRDHTQIHELRTDLTGQITAVRLPYLSALDEPGLFSFSVSLSSEPNGDVVFGTVGYSGDLKPNDEIEVQLEFEQPVPVTPDTRIFINIANLNSGTIRMRSTYLIHETSWDDGLPWGVDGRGLGGRYEVCNLELYWHDDQDDDFDGVPDKVQRIVDCLEQGEVLTISSNRQYGTIPRVTERYPLTAAYYRALLGCPEGESVTSCYATAEVGAQEGQLGFQLTHVFASHPQIGPWVINDQLAEEAFTVYDHPKVLILEKQKDFDPQRVFNLLAAVDVSRVTHVLPRDAGEQPKDLLLPENRWLGQQAGGTWSALFNTENLVNRWPALTVLIWWLAVFFLGLLMFPFTRRILGSLRDQGWALSRILGLLVFGWMAWMLGSFNVPVERGTLAAIIMGLLLASAALAWYDRQQLRAFFKDHWRQVLFIEALAVVFFLVDLGIRAGNPDLWHPAKGGEKPMDFSYLNAVIKSTTFPPYDPWFAGGYINYYYYGFVLVGMPIKLLGIIPSTAYNLVIPTLLSLLALGSFTAGSNLVYAAYRRAPPELAKMARTAGILAAVLVVLAGNLGTARMFYDGFKRIGTQPDAEEGEFIVGAVQAARGLGRYLSQNEPMPYPMDQWYWNPSRAITPGEGEAGPITEFPFFTFLYGDLHAHMISRPLTVFAICWALSGLLSAQAGTKRSRFDVVLWLFSGALVLGSLRPTNTWDFPLYWALGAISVGYATWTRRRNLDFRTWAEALGGMVILLAAAQLLYQPYHHWYGLGYEKIELWAGAKTPLIDYLTVHGLPLFFITTWMAWDTRQWMASTPLSALNRLRPKAGLLSLAALLAASMIIMLAMLGYTVAWIVGPLLAWAGLLLLRPGLPLGRRIILFLMGTTLALTSFVEVVVLQGDISRMNTVFKFYLQVWELFNLSAAVACILVVIEFGHWKEFWRWAWGMLSIGIIFAALLYPMVASMTKIRDRMSLTAPASLDGMNFMLFTPRHHELGEELDLSEDYAGIRWMQEHVAGSPVIIEANVPEYRWGSRFTIYTGLPGVLGWRWHQFQQRVSSADHSVDQRLFDITEFYLTRSPERALELIEKYGVRYIVVGGLERAYYAKVEPCWAAVEGPGINCDLRGYPMGMPLAYDIPLEACTPIDSSNPEAGSNCPTLGLEKFREMTITGDLMLVYHDEGMSIYEVSR